MTNKFALCVGINQFKNFPSATLQGCVNDAHDMAALLKDLLGFKDSDILKLTDQQATKVRIMEALNKMVDGAKAGHYTHLVFSLSSHGTQMPDLDKDESDKADEAFCPHDLAQKGAQWDRDHIILDDELHDLFVQLPAEVLLEVYLDTCHSGTGLKAIDLLLDRKPRYLPPPSVEAFRDMENRRTWDLYSKLSRKKFDHPVLWAACRSDQTSADAHIDNGWHGAFTYYFCREMRKSANKLSRAKLLKLVRADLVAGHYTQIPQLECRATLRKAAPSSEQRVLQ